MDFYRVFPWNGVSVKGERGGPFFVARSKQGQGRHDIPDLDGVLYCSREPVSSIAEFIHPFRGQKIGPAHFVRADGSIMALVRFQISGLGLTDLDDPENLVRLKIRPSEVLTRNRNITKAIAARLYHQGAAGFLWPSALESSWINASLFESRIAGAKAIRNSIVPVSLSMPELIEAAKLLGVYY